MSVATDELQNINYWTQRTVCKLFADCLQVVCKNTNIWRDNDATSVANEATSAANGATSALDENKRIIDGIVVKKVKAKMTSEELIACIVEACIVEHSVDELGALINKTSKYLSDRFIPQLVADGVLLPTKPRHSPGQTYITNPKYKNSK